MNYDEMRTFVPAMCPNCSAHMKVDTSTKIARCESCGTECLVQDAIKTLNVSGTVNVENATINLGANTSSLLQRVEIMLADGDFSGAMEKCETILDIEPTNAQAYIYELMISLKVRRQDELANREKPFDKNNYYQKAIKFGDENTKAILKGYIEQINARNESIRLAQIYNQAVKIMQSALSESDYLSAIELFNSIASFKDSNNRIEICQNRIEEIRARKEAERLAHEKREKAAAKRRRRIIAIGTPVAGVILIFVILFVYVITPNQKYKNAMSKLESGDFEQAYHLLEELGKKDIVNESKYNRAIAYADSGDYVAAYKLLIGLNYKESDKKLEEIKPKYQKMLLLSSEAGSSVFWGSYEQDNDVSNGKEDIEWIILKKEDNKVLLLSKFALDYMNFSNAKITSWDSCSLRRWLNGTFCGEAFNNSERERIIASNADNDTDTLPFTTYSYNETIDKVFLLSVKDTYKYLGQPETYKCKATAYCASKSAEVVDNGYCNWWLRTSHYVLRYTQIAFIDQNGSINTDGNESDTEYAIRPAMWVSLLDIEQAVTEHVDKAVNSIKARDYDAAYMLLGELGDNETVTSARYDKALEMINVGDFESAFILLKGIKYKDSENKLNDIRLNYQKSLIENAKVGSTINFGMYEQDNNPATEKESIEWIVLAKDDDRILVTSKYVLDCISYHKKEQKITWDKCDLRKWLNNEFYNGAFVSEEQNRIINSVVQADKNPSFKTSPGKDTKDKVFLLSMTEAKKYFDSDSARICKGTRFAYSKNRYFNELQQCCWWLRTPGSDSYSVSVVRYEGCFPSYYEMFDVKGYDDWSAYDDEPCGVRPAMWISLK